MAVLTHKIASDLQQTHLDVAVRLLAQKECR